MISIKMIKSALALLAACHCALAGAKATATATVSLQFHLIDLDETDALAPGISFIEHTGSVRAGAQLSFPAPPSMWGQQADSALGATSFEDVSAAAELTPDVFGSASIDLAEGSPAGPHRVRVDASAQAEERQQGTWSAHGLAYPGHHALRFVLAPNTGLKVTATASLVSEVTIGHVETLAAGGRLDWVSEYAESSVGLRFYGNGATDVSVWKFLAANQAPIYDPATGLSNAPPSRQSWADVLELEFLNPTAANREGQLFPSVSAHSGVAVFVPEPAPMALIVAGAAVIAWGLPRRLGKS